MDKIKNYTSKPISEFNSQDTFYGQKTEGGYTYTFFVEFVKFKKGVITGKVCGKIQPNNYDSLFIGQKSIRFGSEISFRITKCYLKSNNGVACWFQKIEGQYRCIETKY